MNVTRRRTAVVAALAALAGPALVAGSAGPAHAAAANYQATITRTLSGIPHVVAKDFGSLGFGHGFATAETNLCVLEDLLVTARGQRSRYFGGTARSNDQVTPDTTNLQTDTLFTDIANRHVVEDLLTDPKAGPSATAKDLVAGYAAGVNAYLTKIGGAGSVNDPQCRNAAYLTPDVTALDVWRGIYAANLLTSTGRFIAPIVEATPPSLGGPVLPTPPLPGLPATSALLAGLGKDPTTPFGSNATAIGKDASKNGRGMLLGNPHTPWRGRYRFEQVQLTIPGQYDVAGASLIGSPVVNLGFTKDVAWSHTVSSAWHFTPYEYKVLPTSTTTYLDETGPLALEHRTVDVTVKAADGTLSTVTQDVYRTPQGYVLDDPAVMLGWTTSSVFAIRDANAEQLRSIDTFLEMGRAHDVRDLLAKQDAGGGMAWFDTVAADRNGDTVYADHSVVPAVTDALAAQCNTSTGTTLYAAVGLPVLDGTYANTTCAWGTDADAARPGVFGPAHLPSTVRTDWVANANDSHWLPNPAEKLEGFARIIGCEKCQRSLRTRMVYRYVQDRLSGADGLATHHLVTAKLLRGFQHQNRVYGGELARENGDLDTICQSASGEDACAALAAWDGRSNPTSHGYALVEEFFKRLPTDGSQWKVPFDAADPLNTPRDLDQGNAAVVKAMTDAIAYLKSKSVAADALWGDLHVAGDDYAPAVGVGGGDAVVGNANVTVSIAPRTNSSYFSAVTYGSSHLQAVSFTGTGVAAKTLLTYAQATDPTSAFDTDQTSRFAHKRWISFPFTSAQIARTKLSVLAVSGPRV